MPSLVWAASFLALHLPGLHAEEGVCLAGTSGGGCTAALGGSNESGAAALSEKAGCAERGFDPLRLRCAICDTLKVKLEERGEIGQALVEECLACCKPEVAEEKFSSARLIVDAAAQDRDQDVHDFIKRKAPRFPRLEVVYQEDAQPAIELEQDDDENRVLRAEVAGWKSEHLFEFLTRRLAKTEGDEEAATAAKGVWTAEIQSCSG